MFAAIAFPGQLPPTLRVAAVVQAFVLLFFAAIVAVRAGILLPGWFAAARKLIWPVIGLSVVSVVLNAMTKSTSIRAGAIPSWKGPGRVGRASSAP